MTCRSTGVTWSVDPDGGTVPISSGWVCGPTRTVTLQEEPVGVKWCFQCRKRVEFTDRLRGDSEPSYYEPMWMRSCANGHADGDLFPGWVREPS